MCPLQCNGFLIIVNNGADRAGSGCTSKKKREEMVVYIPIMSGKRISAKCKSDNSPNKTIITLLWYKEPLPERQRTTFAIFIRRSKTSHILAISFFCAMVQCTRDRRLYGSSSSCCYSSLCRMFRAFFLHLYTIYKSTLLIRQNEIIPHRPVNLSSEYTSLSFVLFFYTVCWKIFNSIVGRIVICLWLEELLIKPNWYVNWVERAKKRGECRIIICNKNIKLINTIYLHLSPLLHNIIIKVWNKFTETMQF